MRESISALKRLVGRTRWSIGIYVGDTPVGLAPVGGDLNPVLTRADVTDMFASFIADPFMIRVDQLWHMFFEVLTLRQGRRVGVIAHATSRDGLRWQYDRRVLSEPFHLSYPHVFEWNSEYYMIPETQVAGSVRLYRADPFPTRWVFVRELVKGPVLFDSSVFRHDGRWWMFTETNPALTNDTLRLLHAPDLLGPWREHPKSPVVTGDPLGARPAGRVIVEAERILRFAQHCAPDYGVGVSAFEVTRLTGTEYEERRIEPPILGPGSTRWNSRGMHQIDAHRREDGTWIACVDGWHRGLVGADEIVHRLQGARRAAAVRAAS